MCGGAYSESRPPPHTVHLDSVSCPWCLGWTFRQEDDGTWYAKAPSPDKTTAHIAENELVLLGAWTTSKVGIPAGVVAELLALEGLCESFS